MICPTLETSQLTAGQECRLVIKLTNTGPRVCRGVIFRVRLPSEIVALRGQERVDIDELLPGASSYLRLVVRPAQSGAFTLASTNFHYRDSYDQPVTGSKWHQQVVVEAARRSPEQHDYLEAERHARAQRWEAAWPLYLRARAANQALACLQRSVQRLQRQQRWADVCAQYLAYAQTVHQIGAPDLGYDSRVIQGLKQAMTWYAQAGQFEETQQSRQLLSFLTRSPLLDVRIASRFDANFIAGAASLVAVEITNCGYGPARQVQLALSGMLERPDEHEFGDLPVGQTEIWEACVIPSHPGPCAIRLQAAAVPYGGGEPITVSLRGVVAAQHAGLLEQISRLQGANIYLKIDNFAAPGAANITNQDSVLINRAPLVGDSSQHSTAAPHRLEDPGQRHCQSCDARVEPTQKFCSRCGARLRSHHV